MSGEVALFVCLGAAAGGFVNGLAGFGTALFALGFWLQVMPPVQAVAVSVSVSAITGLQGVWEVRQAVKAEPLRLLRFVLPGLAGIPIGIALLSRLDAHILKLFIAAFLLIYATFFLLRRSLPRFERRTPLLDGLVGFLGGLLGGLTGISGALPAMWCALRPWPKQATRAVLQPFNVAVLATTAGGLLLRGAYGGETPVYFALALTTSVFAAQFGIATFRRLNDVQFRWLLIGMMFVLGCSLLVRELA